MAQESETGAKDHYTQRDHIGDDEVSELQRPPSFYQKVREQAERFASTRLGQFVIERVDRGLKLIEDTTKWSLPQEKNSNTVQLERPLPWVPFLLLIVLLRLARIWLSLGALMIGNGPISPADMIYFIQTRRRKLRAIRVHGLRVMRHRQLESSSVSGKSFAQKLGDWMSRAICRPGVQRANSGRMFSVREVVAQQQSNQQPANQSVSKRPREEDTNPDQNLTIDEMLSKYANENSEDDSDFVPNAEDESSSDSSTSGSDTESHSSEQISSNEEQENAEQHKENIKPNQNHQQQDKKVTVNGNGNNDKEKTEVAAQRSLVVEKEDQWKASPGHLSAALTKTHCYNTTAAAGSPNNFNNCFVTQPLLKNAIVHAAPMHSTPNSELEEIHSAGSDLEEATRQSISMAQQATSGQQDTPPASRAFKQHPHQQQQQRQFNHSHQRFRGRNRR